MCFIVMDQECQPLLVKITVAFVAFYLFCIPFQFLYFLMGAPITYVMPRIEKGTLYALDYDEATSTLDYNISVVFSFPVSSINLRVSFSNLAAAPSYGGQKLGADLSLPSFTLWRKETRMVPLDVQGRQNIRAVVATTYTAEAARGYFTVEAGLQMQEGTSGLTMQYFVCTLLFPSPAPRGAPNLFDGAECIYLGARKLRWFE